MDLLAEEPGGLLLIDYKSDRVAPGADLEQVVERDYSVQRLLYALAALRSGAARVEVVHWFLARPEEPVGAVYRAPEGEALGRRLAELARRARAGVYEVSPTPHRALCESCPGRRTLCSWGEAETMREQPEPEQPSPGDDRESPLRLF